ncbi:uncharacterized protein [Drosophila tropicalis]|uniref:uncharacterized protein n=1 Tax=Drosophila tropicalis TaxID=46794 RepID=UPI0035ABCD06
MENNRKKLFAELKEICAFLNTTDTGFLTVDSLRNLMVELGHPVSETELKEMINAVDKNAEWESNGQIKIDFNNLYRVMLEAERDEQLKLFIKMFDFDKDGYLNSEELRLALTVILEEDMDMALIDAMMKEADADGDGRLSYDELLKMFIKYGKI